MAVRGPQRFEALIGGFHTTPAVIEHDGNQRGVQLHVTPAGARALFGIPASELVTTVVPLDAVWGRTATELVERVGEADSWDARFAAIDRVLARAAAGRAEVPAAVRPETAEAMRRLVTVRGDVDISSVATDVGWSRRHLSEQFGAEYGVTPKEMARVLRFERSKQLFVRRGPSDAGGHRRRVRVRRSGPHGARVADAGRVEPDAVAGGRAAARRPRHRRAACGLTYGQAAESSRRMLPA